MGNWEGEKVKGLRSKVLGHECFRNFEKMIPGEQVIN